VKLCGIVLAAGASTRMGRDKAQLVLPSSGDSRMTFLQGQIELLKHVTHIVIVVAGGNASALAPLVQRLNAKVVMNPAPERGQFSSLQEALREAERLACDAAVIALVDRPPAQPATLDLLQNKFREAAAAGKWAVVPEYRERHGHPIFISSEMIRAFLRAPATATAREVEHSNQEKIKYVPVEDPAITMNVDTPEDYERLLHTRPDS
jgi:molybdenum cofactor cytidylyltransferase